MEACKSHFSWALPKGMDENQTVRKVYSGDHKEFWGIAGTLEDLVKCELITIEEVNVPIGCWLFLPKDESVKPACFFTKDGLIDYIFSRYVYPQTIQEKFYNGQNS